MEAEIFVPSRPSTDKLRGASADALADWGWVGFMLRSAKLSVGQRADCGGLEHEVARGTKPE